MAKKFLKQGGTGVKDKFGSRSALADQMKDVVRENIKILPELQKFIRPLNEQEYNLLKLGISKDGCKEPLKLWRQGDDYIIVDGHHRYQICSELGVEFKYELLELADISAVKQYMIRLQMGRRNLTAQEVSYFRGVQYNLLKDGHGGGRVVGGNKKTSEILAEEFHVGEKTIRRDAVIATGVDSLPEDERILYLSGESYLKKQDVEYIGKMQPEDLDVLLSVLREGGSVEAYEASKQQETFEEDTVETSNPVDDNVLNAWQKFELKAEKEVNKLIKSNDQEQINSAIERFSSLLEKLKSMQ
ncbi:ParB N-terminal domain-containing protein [Limibacter armeniacum]|uniref:ParB N-terminal domain-containing protein n=1 Tax=Limibacter armeniacum TaxID=466084 RepID=UPI002FE5124A